MTSDSMGSEWVKREIACADEHEQEGPEQLREQPPRLQARIVEVAQARELDRKQRPAQVSCMRKRTVGLLADAHPRPFRSALGVHAGRRRSGLTSIAM